MKKLSREMEVSWQAMAAVTFMVSACLYVIYNLLYVFIQRVEGAHLVVPAAFIIHGVMVSVLYSGAFILCFGMVEHWRGLARYFCALAILLTLFGVSLLIPQIRSNEGLIWLAALFAVSFPFLTAVSILSEKRHTKTGIRSVLLWELK
ncbi:MAG: hypothetical protein LBU90_02510 [Bacteroidales bacterium]|jgi:hypothetical protein|nr:hypothetical protein [Bacteroidales bacterium]